MRDAKNNGFSLIEMSILIAVLAIFAVGILTQLPTQKEYKEVTSVDSKMEKIREALDIYLSNNNHLPCPANGDLQMSDASFGTVTDCTTAPTSGVVDIDDVDGAVSDDDVRIGVLPVKELGIKADYMFDEWGNRFMYAVHKDLTNATDYAAYPTASVGGIVIQDGAGNPLNSSVVPYLIMSNGKDGRGAFTKAGVYNACSAATEDTDKSNCAWSTSTGAAALTFTADGIRDDVTSADFFYDKLAWSEMESTPAAPTSVQTYYSVSAGLVHTCAIAASTQKLWCWGDVNWVGSPSPRPTPEQIAGTENWDSVDSDTFSTCALSTAGNAYCWGTRDYGKLGDGTQSGSARTTPNLVTNSGGPTAGNWTYIDTDGSHSCGINGGSAYCWGNDAAGRLGNGTSTTGNQLTPSRVIDANNSSYSSDWIQVAAGYQFSCGIKGAGTAGRLYCWGDNASYNVAPSGSEWHYPYETGAAYDDWEFVVADDHTACAIRSGGKLYCWGNNDYRQSGTGLTSSTVNTPTEVTALGDGWEAVTLNKMGQLASHGTTVCGIHTGSVYCWGDETQFGKTGNGSQVSLRFHSTPQPLAAEAHSNYVSIDMSSYHVCAARSSGELYCWGRNLNNEFQFGNGTTTGSNIPVRAANGMSLN